MKRALLLGVLGVSGLTQAQVKPVGSNPYLGQPTTRSYYLSDLESCPGLLDLQAGDLWTLTFPENITNFFLTKGGVVEAKAEDNRLILTGLTTTGSVPLMVLTENAQAPKFMITMQAGAGGRFKDVRILSGQPPKSSCPVSGSTGAQAAPPVAPGVSAPVAAEQDQVMRTSPVLAVSQARPVPAALPVRPVTPGTSTFAARPPSTAFKVANLPAGMGATYLDAQQSLKLSVKLTAPTLLTVKFTNTLGSAVQFRTQDLSYGSVRSRTAAMVTVPAQKTVTVTVRMAEDVSRQRVRTNEFAWTGTLTSTGAVLTVRGRTL